MTITEFLLARIAEDEALALAAGDVRVWRTDEGTAYLAGGNERILVITPSSRMEMGWWNHASRHLPGRVLAECEAKRAIIAEHCRYGDWRRTEAGGIHGYESSEDDSCAGCGFDAMEELRVKHIDQCETLRALASIYADHADHRQEWRP